MRKILDIIKLIVCLVILVAFVLIGLPLMCLVQPFIWGKNLFLERRYARFLRHLEGKCFFCYNYNHGAFIEHELLPGLPDSIEVVFTNGSILKTRYNKRFFFKILHELNDFNGFPYVIQVTNGNVRCESLNRELSGTIRQNRPIELLLTDIYRFLE